MTDVDLYDAGEYAKTLGKKSFFYKYLSGDVATNTAHTLGTWDMRGYTGYTATCQITASASASDRTWQVLGSLEIDNADDLDDKPDSFFSITIATDTQNPNDATPRADADHGVQLDTRRFTDEGTCPLIRARILAATGAVSYKFLLRIFY